MASTQLEKDEETERDDERAETEDRDGEADASSTADSTAAAGSEDDSIEDRSRAAGESEDDADGGSDDDGESEESDDSGSDDSDADDSDESDESDESDSDESDERSDAAASAGAEVGEKSSAKPGKAKVKRNKDGLTAGARLAAAKAAKAARKAAKRGKEKKGDDPLTQVRESELAKRAEQAGSWAKENPRLVWAAVAAVVIALGGWVGWTSYRDQQAHAAGTLLASALEIAQAEIVEEDADEDEGEDAPRRADDSDEDDAPTFPTEEARAEAALEAFRAVLSQYPSSSAAVWARLGEARALADLERYDDARGAFEQAEREGGADPAVTWRALEGKGFTYEAEQEWGRALEVYQQLTRVDDGRYEPVGKYHIARMHLAQGERQQATDALRELVQQLERAEDDEEDEAQEFAYVLAQARTRLRELDPDAAPPPPAFGGDSPLMIPGGGGPGGDMSNEQLQELIRRFQQQQLQQQGGGAE